MLGEGKALVNVLAPPARPKIISDIGLALLRRINRSVLWCVAKGWAPALAQSPPPGEIPWVRGPTFSSHHGQQTVPYQPPDVQKMHVKK